MLVQLEMGQGWSRKGAIRTGEPFNTHRFEWFVWNFKFGVDW